MASSGEIYHSDDDGAENKEQMMPMVDIESYAWKTF